MSKATDLRAYKALVQQQDETLAGLELDIGAITEKLGREQDTIIALVQVIMTDTQGDKAGLVKSVKPMLDLPAFTELLRYLDEKYE